MKFVLLFLSLALLATALHLPPATLSRSKVISFPIRKMARSRERAGRHTGPQAGRRALPPGPVPGPGQVAHQSLIDQSDFFLADFGIGTPPQPVSLLVDTGGWITWVNPLCNEAYKQDQCSSLPSYNIKLSDPPPQHVHAMDQTVRYGPSMGAVVQGYADVFTWGATVTESSGSNSSSSSKKSGGDNNSTTIYSGGVKVKDQPFGVADVTVGVSIGVLGLGPDGMDGFNSAISNLSVVATMAEQGVISSRLFSLTYGEAVEWGKHTGTLVFGGVDRNRFSGKLFNTPILPIDQGLDGWRYWARVAQVEHHRPNGKPGFRNTTSDFGSSYLLDSSASGIFVERSMYDALLAELNLTSSTDLVQSFPVVSCALANSTGALAFSFAGSSTNSVTSNGTSNGTTSSSTIRVPYAALIHPVAQNNTAQCYLALGSAGDDFDNGSIWPILGVEFFKAAYAVFDWDNQELALAQGADCGQPDLFPIGKWTATGNITGNCRPARQQNKWANKYL